MRQNRFGLLFMDGTLSWAKHFTGLDLGLENVTRQFCPSFMEQWKTKPSQSQLGLWIVII